MRRIAATLVGFISLATVLSTWADDSYQGTLNDNGRPFSVALSIKPSVQEGDLAGRIRFNEPWVCGLSLVFVGADAARTASYVFRGAAAGRCTTLAAGSLKARPDGEGVAIQLFDSANKLRYSGKLAKASS
ncbi:hypothetical protein PS3A_52570 [Pseudomonas sp. 3A(2025)]